MAEKIVCLGWGSLVWRLGGLPVERFSGPSRPPWARCIKEGDDIGDWQCDGPTVLVEFMRQSSKDRLTLVLHKQGTPVTSFWARMTVHDLDKAKEYLATREGRTPLTNIHHWPKEDDDPETIPDLRSWASNRDIDRVIWTGLPPEFCGLKGIAPTEEQAIAYLRKLSEDGKAKEAKKYIRYAPPQINTAYRRRIVDCLGSDWGFPADPSTKASPQS